MLVTHLCSRRRHARTAAIGRAPRRHRRRRGAATGRVLALAALPIGLMALAVVGWSPGSATRAAAQGDRWVEPVIAPVVDGYRPPEHVGAPGNRGWEYATVPGTVVVAAGAGVVVFAGSIGDSRYVSIQHPDGRRTTYSHVADLAVAAGDRVGAGDRVATSGTRLHFGLRVGDHYRDPGELFGSADTTAPGVVGATGTRLLPMVDRPVPGGDRRRSTPEAPTAPGVAPAGRGPVGARGERRPALGRWLASVAPPSIGGAAQGWTGAATDTLAAGPRHTAAGP